MRGSFDWREEFSPEELAKARQQAAEDEQEKRRTNGQGGPWRELELIRFADLKPRLDGRPLVKGLLEREQTSVIYGEAGCGKTFLALDIALRVAAGLDWFGRKVMGGPVIYCACEAGRSIANRVEAFKIAHSCDENSGIPFAAVTSPIDLCHPQIGDLQKLTNLLHETHDLSPVSLIVIDTVSRALAGGNENSPDDMGAFVRSLDQLREQLGCHILGVHHSGKDTSKGSRGHSLLHCAVDTELLIVRDDTTSISVAKVTKQRDGIAGIEIAFRLRPIELGLDDDGELVTSCVVEPADGQQRRPSKARLPAAQARALQLLNDTIVREGTTPPANSHIPPNTLCVTESLWRECCYRGSISGSDKLQAKQKAFKRSADDLITAGYIGKWEPWVWAVKQ